MQNICFMLVTLRRGGNDEVINWLTSPPPKKKKSTPQLFRLNHNLRLRIPPELESTVENVLKNIQESQEWYSI